MKYKQNMISVAIGSLMVVSGSAYATLPSDAHLSIDLGNVDRANNNTATGCAQGSCFSMELITNFFIWTNIEGFNGINVGTIQLATGSHTGLPDGSEQPDIDQPWDFFKNTGLHQTTSPTNILSDDGAGNVTLDFSGWDVTWNSIPSISMNAPPDSGVATMTCGTDCNYGDTYEIVYITHVSNPCGGCGFEGVPYRLILRGEVTNTAPVADSFAVNVGLVGTSDIDLTTRVADAESNINWASLDITADAAYLANCGSDPTHNNNGVVTVPQCPAGIYSFTYQVADTEPLLSNTATVTVTASDGPITLDDSADTGGVTPIDIDVLANDIDGANLIDEDTVAIVSGPSHGTVPPALVPPLYPLGIVTYTATAGFTGIDTFVYQVSDTVGKTSQATVSVAVSALNDPASSDTFTAGDIAQNTGNPNGVVSMADIGVIDNGETLSTVADLGIAQSCVGGCFDFVISGVSGSTQVVLPLSVPIPAVTGGGLLVYRKLDAVGWHSFDTSGGNAIHSAPGTFVSPNTTCPEPGSSLYAQGINAGDRCLRLTIVDNGPNDADAVVGTVTDPGGIAETYSVDTRQATVDGCSMTAGSNVGLKDRADWLLIAGFLGLLGLFKLQRRRLSNTAK